MSFKGKNALITGSSRGIGRGIALKLAEKGARVAVHYYRNRNAAQATLKQIRELGSDGFLVQADVCHPDEVIHIFQQGPLRVRLARYFRQQCANRSADFLPGSHGDHAG